jgi:histidinol-phosphate/aromatic aminotransferase/cobyric acid decarboxylase-like protein
VPGLRLGILTSQDKEWLEEQILIKDLTGKIANGRQYVRIAIRSRRENEQLAEALKIKFLHRLGGQE